MISALKRFYKWIAGIEEKKTDQAASRKFLQVSALPAFTKIMEGSSQITERGRKLFMPAPVESPELLVGRDEQLSQLDDALDQWERGHSTSIALVGPQGCGKTSLTNCFLTKLQHQSVLRCDMEERLCNEEKVIEFFCRIFHVDPPVDDEEDSMDKKNPESNVAQEEADDFYHALYANCGGNFHAALYFLLLCGRFEKDRMSLFLWPPDTLDAKFIKDMTRLQQFTLSELVIHGVLSPEEHARIFRTVGIQSKMVLAHLEQLNLLKSADDQDNAVSMKTYDLSPVIHHTVTSALQQMNLLY